MLTTTDPRLATTASPEPAAQTAALNPNHCQNYDDCNASSCPACEPLLTAADLGEAFAVKLRDTPVEFYAQLDTLDEDDRTAVSVALGVFCKVPAKEATRFIARSRARALACGVL